MAGMTQTDACAAAAQTSSRAMASVKAARPAAAWRPGLTTAVRTLGGGACGRGALWTLRLMHSPRGRLYSRYRRERVLIEGGPSLCAAPGRPGRLCPEGERRSPSAGGGRRGRCVRGVGAGCGAGCGVGCGAGCGVGCGAGVAPDVAPDVAPTPEAHGPPGRRPARRRAPERGEAGAGPVRDEAGGAGRLRPRPGLEPGSGSSPCIRAGARAPAAQVRSWRSTCGSPSR